MISEFFTEKSKFSKYVIDLVSDDIMGDKTYMDVVLQLCEEHNIDPSAVASLLSDEVTQKIKDEAVSLNFYKKTAKLPF